MGGIGEERGIGDLRRSGSLLVMTSPAFAVSKNVDHVKTLPEGKWATAINFLNYGGQDVMMVTGRFGLKSYSLADPANPQLLDQITSEDLSSRAIRPRTSRSPSRVATRSPRSGRTRTWTSTRPASSC